MVGRRIYKQLALTELRGVTGSNIILSHYETDITQFEFIWNVWDTFLCFNNHRAGERALTGVPQWGHILWIHQLFNIMHKSCIMFLVKKMLCILFMGTTTDHHGVVTCPVQTNKTSNSIPSVIKGYLDRNINISLKLNQMLLHGGRQDSEEGREMQKNKGGTLHRKVSQYPGFSTLKCSFL